MLKFCVSFCIDVREDIYIVTLSPRISFRQDVTSGCVNCRSVKYKKVTCSWNRLGLDGSGRTGKNEEPLL